MEEVPKKVREVVELPEEKLEELDESTDEQRKTNTTK